MLGPRPNSEAVGRLTAVKGKNKIPCGNWLFHFAWERTGGIHPDGHRQVTVIHLFVCFCEGAWSREPAETHSGVYPHTP